MALMGARKSQQESCAAAGLQVPAIARQKGFRATAELLMQLEGRNEESMRGIWRCAFAALNKTIK